MNLKSDKNPDGIDNTVKHPDLKEINPKDQLKIVEDLEENKREKKDKKADLAGPDTASESPNDRDSKSIEKNPARSKSTNIPSTQFEKLPVVWPGFLLAFLFLFGFYLGNNTNFNGYPLALLASLATTVWWSYCVIKTHKILEGKTWFDSIPPVTSVISIIHTKLFHLFFVLLLLSTTLYSVRRIIVSGSLPFVSVVGFFIVFLYWLIKEALWSYNLSRFISLTKSQQKFGANVDSFVSNILSLSMVWILNLTTVLFAPVLAPILILINNMRLRDLVNIKANFEFDTKKKKIIRYRRFAAIEQWLIHRFTKNKSKYSKSIQILMVFLAPVLLFLGFAASMGILALLALVLSSSDSTGAVEIANQANSKYVITAFLASLAAGFMGMFTIYRNSPSHIEFNEFGIAILKKGTDKWIRKDFSSWDEISEITIQSLSTTAGAANSVLLFHRTENRTPIKINLNSVPSIEEKQDILTSIEKYAPKIKRSSDVIMALQLPAEHSYTELWLQALAAPPKREKLQPLQPGAVVRDGRYRVQRKLGVGGQGFAYLATDNSTEKTVVLKEFILPVFVDIQVRKAALEQFESEAKILGNLNHPQIVKLEDFMVEDHRAYLVLEHIDGKSLREIVKDNGPLSEEQVRSLAKQMCTVLEHLHSQSPPVVHRDFTPDNLILNSDGTLKLIDFNVAQQTDSTTIAKVVGKQSYLPTEQFQGKPTSQSDIYAMGCTLHFLLTGDDPVPISQSKPKDKVSTISKNINDIVARATENSLDKRYKSAKEVAIDLEHSIEDPSKTNSSLPESDLPEVKVVEDSKDKPASLTASALAEPEKDLNSTHLTTKSKQSDISLVQKPALLSNLAEKEKNADPELTKKQDTNIYKTQPVKKENFSTLAKDQSLKHKKDKSIARALSYIFDCIAILILLTSFILIIF